MSGEQHQLLRENLRTQERECEELLEDEDAKFAILQQKSSIKKRKLDASATLRAMEEERAGILGLTEAAGEGWGGAKLSATTGPPQVVGAAASIPHRDVAVSPK